MAFDHERGVLNLLKFEVKKCGDENKGGGGEPSPPCVEGLKDLDYFVCH